jgi:hypothetical protein
VAECLARSAGNQAQYWDGRVAPGWPCHQHAPPLWRGRFISRAAARARVRLPCALPPHHEWRQVQTGPAAVGELVHATRHGRFLANAADFGGCGGLALDGVRGSLTTRCTPPIFWRVHVHLLSCPGTEGVFSFSASMKPRARRFPETSPGVWAFWGFGDKSFGEKKTRVGSVTRRGGRVVYCGGLENRCGRKVTGGSNPSLSATEAH